MKNLLGPTMSSEINLEKKTTAATHMVQFLYIRSGTLSHISNKFQNYLPLFDQGRVRPAPHRRRGPHRGRGRERQPADAGGLPHRVQRGGGRAPPGGGGEDTRRGRGPNQQAEVRTGPFFFSFKLQMAGGDYRWRAAIELWKKRAKMPSLCVRVSEMNKSNCLLFVNFSRILKLRHEFFSHNGPRFLPPYIFIKKIL